MRSVVTRLQQTEGFVPLCREAARQMRALTGFDRVMVCRFAEDHSGEVIAEAVRSGLDPYLGLHYPASDIPRQARALSEKERKVARERQELLIAELDHRVRNILNLIRGVVTQSRPADGADGASATTVDDRT